MELFANLERWARECPDRPAHIGVNGQGIRVTLTYGELLASAGRLAAHLRNELPSDHSPVSQRAYRAGDKSEEIEVRPSSFRHETTWVKYLGQASG